MFKLRIGGKHVLKIIRHCKKEIMNLFKSEFFEIEIIIIIEVNHSNFIIN